MCFVHRVEGDLVLVAKASGVSARTRAEIMVVDQVLDVRIIVDDIWVTQDPGFHVVLHCEFVLGGALAANSGSVPIEAVLKEHDLVCVAFL